MMDYYKLLFDSLNVMCQKAEKKDLYYEYVKTWAYFHQHNKRRTVPLNVSIGAGKNGKVKLRLEIDMCRLMDKYRDWQLKKNEFNAMINRVNNKQNAKQ